MANFVPVSAEARELYFFALNNNPRNRFLVASLNKLAAWRDTGDLDHSAARRLLLNNCRDVARNYVAQHCAKSEHWQDIFSEQSRGQCADLLLRFIVESGEA